MLGNAKSLWATIATLPSMLFRAVAALLLFVSLTAPAIAQKPAEQADLKRIETYLNELGTMQSRFVQANPDGTHSEGTMYLQRPGRLRFEYDPPDPYLIITYGKWFIYVDKELDEATYVPVEQTPAFFIVKENIQFGDSLRVASFRRGNSVFRVELEQIDQPDAGRVMLIFTDAPLQLRKWQVLDAQGNLTDTTLINPNFDVPLNEQLFEYEGSPPLNSN